MGGARSLVLSMPELDRARYAALYGPTTGYAPDGAIAAQVREGKLAATNDIASFIHIDDAAQATALALAWPQES